MSPLPRTVELVLALELDGSLTPRARRARAREEFGLSEWRYVQALVFLARDVDPRQLPPELWGRLACLRVQK